MPSCNPMSQSFHAAMAVNEQSEILEAPVTIDWLAGALSGASVRRSRKHLGDMRSLFLNGLSSSLADDTLLYSVEYFGAGPGAAPGGLLFGYTRLEAGKVRDEYFMTHGHFHALPSHAELYLPVAGQGLLLRMERDGCTWAEEMLPGRVHSIDGRHAHRVVNTGSEPLIFWACWPADAGYDYEAIVREGFGLRALDRDGRPTLVPAVHPPSPKENTAAHV
jgi:glucose-6-phosphate isomerase, archaeal